MENINKWPRLTFEKNTCICTNMSTLDPKERRNFLVFKVDDVEWTILIHRTGGINDDLSIYLEVQRKNLPEGWKRTQNFNLAVINQGNDKMTIRKGWEFEFSYDNFCCGFDRFMAFSELNENSGFIVNDTCKIEAGFFFIKDVYEREPYKPVGNIDDYPLTDINNPFFHDMFLRSFSRMKPKFVPLLEKACLEHPSLLVSQKERICRHTAMAFEALGGLLDFLNTIQVKDMDDNMCNYLRQLWSGVQIFGFDLSWLESSVESALKGKDYMEENVNDLETKLEMTRKAEKALDFKVEAKKRLAERALDFKVEAKKRPAERDLDFNMEDVRLYEFLGPGLDFLKFCT